jgi:hypothetical protein
MVVEKLMFHRLFDYLDSRNFFYSYQFGFRPGSNVTKALHQVVEFVCEGLDNRLLVGGLFLDLRKAFDTVDHELLLRKLESVGVRNTELCLFHSFLTGRHQYVSLNGCNSQSREVFCGVPQGSVLGPLLFLIFINDMSMLPLNGKLVLFADDASLFYPAVNIQQISSKIDEDMIIINRYLVGNKLMLNASKSELIVFRTINKRIPTLSITINGSIITASKCVKYLGIILHENLKWSDHHQLIRQKISRSLGLLYKLKFVLNLRAKKSIYFALIHSYLSFATTIWAYTNNNSIQLLQVLQNKSLKTVYNLHNRFPTTQLYLDVAKILPIKALYVRQVLIFAYTNIHSISYHTINFSYRTHNFNTRRGNTLNVNYARLVTTGQKISHIGPKLFNDIPTNLQVTTPFNSFKTKTTHYILSNLHNLL